MSGSGSCRISVKITHNSTLVWKIYKIFHLLAWPHIIYGTGKDSVIEIIETYCNVVNSVYAVQHNVGIVNTNYIRRLFVIFSADGIWLYTSKWITFASHILCRVQQACMRGCMKSILRLFFLLRALHHPWRCTKACLTANLAEDCVYLGRCKTIPHVPFH